MIDFEGRRINSEPSDTIASALLRAGVTAFSRGPKYHRPRGPFCLAGSCGQCHMRVNGAPNIPTCTTAARDGMMVERQNALGSVDVDLLRAVDFLYPGGLDHHHLMTRFKLLNSATQAIARRLAGVGHVPSEVLKPPELVKHSVDIVIVGGGLSARAASGVIAKAGKQSLLIEARPRMDSRAGDYLLNTWVLGVYGEGGKRFVIASDGLRLFQITTHRVIAATGGTERNLLFGSNDLPGVFAGRALARLVEETGVVPGTRIVVVGDHPSAITVAKSLRAQLIEGEPVRATGRSRVTGLVYTDRSGKEKSVRCDTIAVVTARAPSYELAAQAGIEARLLEDGSGFVVKADADGRTALDWLFVCGTAAGHKDPVESGARVGRAACQ